MRVKTTKKGGYLILFIILAIMILSAQLASNTADAIFVHKQAQAATCVIIDAGHGGVDGGAVSCTGMYESQINLQIAQRLNDLMQLLGYETKMIRTEDISVYTSGKTIAEKKISDLKERVRVINNTENAILISIHQNYFQDNRYSGAQVFYAKNSQKFAETIQTKFRQAINLNSNRKIKKADGIYLMEKINCDAVLIECGFLSNKAEEFNLRSPEYQKKIACVIASATSQYLNNKAVA